MSNSYKKRQMYIFLIVLVIGAHAGFQGWRTLLNNFAVEVGGLSGLEMGVVQSVREIPGFLALLALYVILIMREHRLAAFSVIILGAGVALTGQFPTTAGLVLTTLIMSFGFHYYETMNQSLTLQYFSVTDSPLVLGRMRSIAALTNILIGGGIFVVARYLDYSQMFIVLGLIAIGSGVWAMTRDPSQTDLPAQGKKMVFRSQYWLYYVLTFLSGARRQIFVAFAIFLLVEKFDFSVQDITILFVLNNVINYFVNPLIGKAVNRFGERWVLTLEYVALTLIFFGYALTESAWLAGGLYVVDNVFFNFAIAIKTFYQKIADKRDIASGMAVGFTINHIAAVVIPALGGLAWIANYRAVFFSAAALSIVSLVLAQFVPGQLRKVQYND
ncbi:MFS transporter [Pseudodesulfovibrio piezophilus]|uniref:Major facilitator superfamily MFS_1 n=1 Tax=Pseudodesulfovibrio piezophilus (strain DSM 21447 / JCM 15486 / C1TLV30) TaxID=1322246 RepID=M1WTN4_PSEP2|nr:MFS transporter [Pseudodesulfovibrio piezophilus]CCH49772.1 Major facilitator superfamily MFS_1 [Pseudodesulfovibrio piezophilus C1TLV30]